MNLAKKLIQHLQLEKDPNVTKILELDPEKVNGDLYYIHTDSKITIWGDTMEISYKPTIDKFLMAVYYKGRVIAMLELEQIVKIDVYDEEEVKRLIDQYEIN